MVFSHGCLVPSNNPTILVVNDLINLHVNHYGIRTGIMYHLIDAVPRYHIRVICIITMPINIATPIIEGDRAGPIIEVDVATASVRQLKGKEDGV